jgi:nitronate monooxygenase
MCALVEEVRPEIVSFHFGLPDKDMLRRVKAAGCLVVGCATTVKEAVWLENNGVDAVIAQGAEAGGHRGMFLTDDIASQPGTMALVPQVVDAVRVPVIAAGGIADGRDVALQLPSRWARQASRSELRISARRNRKSARWPRPRWRRRTTTPRLSQMS